MTNAWFAILSLLIAVSDRARAATGINCTVLPHIFECDSEKWYTAIGTTLGIVIPIVIVIFVIGVLIIRRQPSNSSVADAERGTCCCTTPDALAVSMQYIGRDLAIYQKPIGGGAFGTVFWGTFRGECCAIKVLNPHATQLLSSLQAAQTVQSEALKRFKNECDTLKRFKHPHLVRYITSCNDPKSNLPLLVMELMDESLTQFLKHCTGKRSRVLPTCTQVSLSCNIASALDYIHTKNLLHRDLCSDNVLLQMTPTLLAKISDFGMSRLIDPEDLDKSLTTLGHREAYLPPEARKINYNEYDSSLDIFSFGVVMVQMVAKVHRIACSADRDIYIKEIKNAEAMSPLYNLITCCVQLNKDRRPNALEISQSLENLSL